MHELDEQLADPRPHAAPKRSDLLLIGGHSDATPRPAGELSVDLSSGPEPHQDVTVLTPQGEIDLATAPVLRQALLPVLEHRIGPVVIDLTEVPFIDSTAVHVLVDTLQQLKLHDRRLAIACREGGQVHRVLALVGLLEIMAVHRSLEGAVIGGDDLLGTDADSIGSASAPQAAVSPPNGRAFRARKG